jgi:hypothetical protein
MSRMSRSGQVKRYSNRGPQAPNEIGKWVGLGCVRSCQALNESSSRGLNKPGVSGAKRVKLTSPRRVPLIESGMYHLLIEQVFIVKSRFVQCRAWVQIELNRACDDPFFFFFYKHKWILTVGRLFVAQPT